MLKFVLPALIFLPIFLCFKEPPTQLAVFQRILSSFSLPAAQITALHDNFIKVDSDQGRWNAIKQFLTKIPAVKQPAVKAILLELMDNIYSKFTGLTEAETILGMTADNKVKFSAKFASLDKQYKGDDTLYFPLFMKALLVMFPNPKYAATWKKFNAWTATPAIKAKIAKIQQFFHVDGKNKTPAYYFNVKGYKRSKGPWEAKVKM